LLAIDQTITPRIPTPIAAASQASTSIVVFTRRRRGNRSSRTLGPLKP
jgi:hypothetical protein